MAQRGVKVTYETIRQWCLKFVQTLADELRRRGGHDQAISGIWMR
jgi:putative transposase